MRQKRDDKGRLVEIPHALKIDPWGEYAIKASLKVESRSLDIPSIMKFTDSRTGENVLTLDERDSYLRVLHCIKKWRMEKVKVGEKFLKPQ